MIFHISFINPFRILFGCEIRVNNRYCNKFVTFVLYVEVENK